MRERWSRIVSGSLLAMLLSSGLCAAAPAKNPFEDTDAVAQPQKVANAGTRQAAPVLPLIPNAPAVQTANTWATGDYASFLLVQPIIQATITFNDETKDSERTSWFQQILSEHGCKTLSIDKKQNQTGNIFNRKKWLTVTARIEGRGFVIRAIKEYYGGTLAKEPGQPQAPADATLKDIVAL